MLNVPQLKELRLQITASFTATLTFFVCGMDYGWSSPAKIILLSNSSYIQTTVDDIYFTEMSLFVGAFVGVLTGPIILQFFGRRTVILMCSLSSFITWTLIATARTILQIIIVRAWTGVTISTLYIAVPMYISETADPKIRGFFSSLVSIMNLSGISLIYFIGYFMSISASASVGVSITLFQFVTFFFHPESPYYFLHRNRKKDATKSLKSLSPYITNVDERIREIAADLVRQKAERRKILDMLKLASTRKSLLISVFLHMTQNFLGISVISMNIHTILGNNKYISNEKSATIFGLTMVVSAIIGAAVIDKFGRRFLFLTSVLFTTLLHTILAIYFFVRDMFIADCTGLEWIPVVCLLSYAVSFKFGAGLLPVVVPAEILPIGIKTFSMSIANTGATFSALFSVYMFHLTIKSGGLYMPFALFALWGVLSEIFFYFYVPETKGKSLEEIQILLNGKDWKDTGVSKNML